jgi:hypothetical protein
MDFYYQAIGTLIIGALSAFLLKELGSRAAPAVGIIISLSVIGGAFGKMEQIGAIFSSLSFDADIERYSRDSLRVVGIGYVGGIAEDVISALGEANVAKIVQTVTRIELIGIAVPYLKEVLVTLIGFINE